jgi:hypothetical protein
MRKRILIAFLFIFLAATGFIPLARVVVNSPKSGDVLQGVVNIKGSSSTLGFQSYEISFAYEGQETENWFLIQQSHSPISDGTLATWDTTTIADGTYRLRLQVILEDRTTEEFMVTGLRVRNYSSIEGSPTQVQELAVTAQFALQPTESIQTKTPKPTPSPLPVNPAQVTYADLSRNAIGGGVTAAVVLLLLGLYLAARSRSRN